MLWSILDLTEKYIIKVNMMYFGVKFIKKTNNEIKSIIVLLFVFVSFPLLFRKMLFQQYVLALFFLKSIFNNMQMKVWRLKGPTIFPYTWSPTILNPKKYLFPRASILYRRRPSYKEFIRPSHSPVHRYRTTTRCSSSSILSSSLYRLHL